MEGVRRVCAEGVRRVCEEGDMRPRVVRRRRATARGPCYGVADAVPAGLLRRVNTNRHPGVLAH